jgi:hypothetical protein
MNILDENILNDQKQLLKIWKIGVHQKRFEWFTKPNNP